MENTGSIKASLYAMPDLLLKDKKLRQKVARNTTDEIDEAISQVFGIIEFRRKTRKREIVEARQTAMYFYKMRTVLSLAQIGMMLGNKDHATVLHAVKTVKNLLETDKEYASKVEEVNRYLISN